MTNKLIIAAKSGDPERVKQLLSRGIAVNATDENLRTALHYASEEGHMQIVKILASHWANFNHVDRFGRTALHATFQRSTNKHLRCLLKFFVSKGLSPSLKDASGNSILHIASVSGNKRGIQLSVELGINIHARNSRGETPIISAGTKCRDEAALQLLIDLGANVKDKDRNGATLLHKAAKSCNEVAVKFALRHGLKVGDRTSSRDSFSALDCVGKEEHSIPIYIDSSDSDTDTDSDTEPNPVRTLLRNAYRNELPRCRFCHKRPAHIQMSPCQHQSSCDKCSASWQSCHCRVAIKRKIDVLDCQPGMAKHPRNDAGGLTETPQVQGGQVTPQVQVRQVRKVQVYCL